MCASLTIIPDQFFWLYMHVLYLSIVALVHCIRLLFIHGSGKEL